MRILFIHRHIPGQFVHLARHLAADRANEVVLVGELVEDEVPGARIVPYRLHRKVRPETHRYVRPYEGAVLHGQAVARVCAALLRRGFVPDVVVAHPGWGGALFVKDVFPDAPLLAYCEFFYKGRGTDLDFDPATPPDLDALCRVRARNAHLLTSLVAADACVSPMEWQRSAHPPALRDRISVIFDGIDSAAIAPDAGASLTLADGRVLRPGDPVVTFAARNLEPYRGFDLFMRALPELLRRHPDAVVLIAGGDRPGYGKPPPEGRTWRELLCEEVRPDPARVHFLGSLDRPRFQSLLGVSALHVYLTVPFVLSWSMLEAMSTGCLVLGSATPPVEEVIVDHVNGHLVPWGDPALLAERMSDLLTDAAGTAVPLRAAARRTVLDRYALDHCLPRQRALLDSLLR